MAIGDFWRRSRGSRLRRDGSGLRFGGDRGFGFVGVRRVLLVSALAFVATASEAAAATGWVRRSVPAPAVANGALSAVSCTSVTACTAVGSYVDRKGVVRTLAERWDGAGWSVQPSPNPPGRTGYDELQAVSCAAAKTCIAVGSGGGRALIERWNGTSWSIESAPPPAGSRAIVLRGVSCASASACIAVGSGGKGALAERWNGSGWSAQSVAGRNVALEGVACAAPRSCVAVGSLRGNGARVSQRTFAARWDGWRWSIQPTPNPSNSGDSVLNAVSCPSSTVCMAVGSAGDRIDSGGVPLAERWDGSRWSLQSPPNPGSDNFTSLFGVSCASAADCTAVGSQSDSGLDTGPPVAERWNGSGWALQSTPSPLISRSAALSAVSCSSGTGCTAVGNYGPDVGFVGSGQVRALAERWSGTTWSIQAAGNGVGATSTVLNSISCTSSSACMAIGGYLDAERTIAFARQWDGAGWKIQTLPRPAGATSIGLGGVSCNYATACTATGSGVSCTSASSCTAVGWYRIHGGRQRPVAERWNGSAWSIQAVPIPARATNSFLTSVSCTSATGCTAIGGYDTPRSRPQPLAERWNGSTWSIQAIPSRPGATDTDLASVSCTSRNFCTAVGVYERRPGRQRTLAESWNGSTWSIQSIPQPTTPRTIDASLANVSCTSLTACTAVGNYEYTYGSYGDEYTGQDTLAARWNGSTWTLQAAPTTGVTGVLSGVSCTSRTACTAVGTTSGAYGQPLAERWNGHAWSQERTHKLRDPGGALDGVSCSSASACTAVGQRTINNGLGFSAPIAEHHS